MPSNNAGQNKRPSRSISTEAEEGRQLLKRYLQNRRQIAGNNKKALSTSWILFKGGDIDDGDDDLTKTELEVHLDDANGDTISLSRLCGCRMCVFLYVCDQNLA